MNSKRTYQVGKGAKRKWMIHFKNIRRPVLSIIVLISATLKVLTIMCPAAFPFLMDKSGKLSE